MSEDSDSDEVAASGCLPVSTHAHSYPKSCLHSFHWHTHTSCIITMSLSQVCGIGILSLAALCKMFWATSRQPTVDLDGPKEVHWLTGNVRKVFEGGLDYCVKLAEQYGGAVKLQSLYGEVVYLSDPLALYHVIVKDQHIFEEPDVFIMNNKATFGDGLIATIGEQHRKQRKLLNPVFSTTNMRELLPTLQPIAHKLTSIVASKLPDDGSYKEIDMLPLLSRSALDGVCQAILGYPSNTLDAAENDEYTEALRKISPLISSLMYFRPLVPMAMRYFSSYWIKKLVDVVTMPWIPTERMKDVREMRRIIEIMDNGSKKAFAEKKAALETAATLPPTDAQSEVDDHKPSGGKDMMDIMLKANTASSSSERLTDAELLGQMNVMVFAGLDTTTSALSRCVYLLAKNPLAQARLRSEIRDAISPTSLSQDGATVFEHENPLLNLSYDTLMNLPFLDGVVRETLRLYPSLPHMGRKVTKATTLPLQFPVRSSSGAEISTIAVHEKAFIVISILAANRNRTIWGDDANEWKPERWLSSDAAAPILGVKDGIRYPGVYSNMMTFLGGSRSCIGFKFAEMEMKEILAALMLRLHFVLPTDPDANGHIKEIQWKLKVFHTPVVKLPAGDGVTPQVPLNVRLVQEEDFKW
ncbi:cytochrome P450 [Suillus clintonianus]|uniref:cytochrome P450 n=1 Tax=Suillus clintonianus TaxID=1904413 RepID=UPI001B86B753|nr:cytochrome P450 [Suillus clintonianus]KAG2150531.1 cytochrome P450 [Suillus clintonianus]